WVHGKIALLLKTSVATGISGQVLSPTGKIVGSGITKAPGQLQFTVNTRLLKSNRASKLQAIVYVNTAPACSVSLSLKVDNIPARFLILKQHGGGLTVRTNEAARLL